MSWGMSTAGLRWITGGGVLYTLGVPFFAMDTVRFAHACVPGWRVAWQGRGRRDRRGRQCDADMQTSLVVSGPNDKYATCDLASLRPRRIRSALVGDLRARAAPR